MRRGACLPRYRCRVCSQEWSRGGFNRVCPGCGDERTDPELVAYGWDGVVHGLVADHAEAHRADQED